MSDRTKNRELTAARRSGKGTPCYRELLTRRARRGPLDSHAGVPRDRLVLLSVARARRLVPLGLAGDTLRAYEAVRESLRAAVADPCDIPRGEPVANRYGHHPDEAHEHASGERAR